MKYFFVALFMVSLWGGCASDTKKTDPAPIFYFDLKGYFEGEAKRLSGMHVWVQKSVSANQLMEKKRLRNINWDTELALFTSSDINKTAWTKSYERDSSATQIIYKAKYPDLKTRRMVIYIKDQKPTYIQIINYQKNYLFENTEELAYYPDSLYQIKKEQHLLFLKKQVYFIEGRINSK